MIWLCTAQVCYFELRLDQATDGHARLHKRRNCHYSFMNHLSSITSIRATKVLSMGCRSPCSPSSPPSLPPRIAGAVHVFVSAPQTLMQRFNYFAIWQTCIILFYDLSVFVYNYLQHNTQFYLISFPVISTPPRTAFLMF